jgi:hypothetical protein
MNVVNALRNRIRQISPDHLRFPFESLMEYGNLLAGMLILSA